MVMDADNETILTDQKAPSKTMRIVRGAFGPIGDNVRRAQTVLNRVSSSLDVRGYGKGAALIKTFTSAAKEMPLYARFRVHTRKTLEVHALNLQAEHYAGWSFITNAKGKISSDTIIENPILCFPGNVGLTNTQEAVSVGQFIKSLLKREISGELLSSASKRIISYGYKDSFPDDENFSTHIEEVQALRLLQDPKYCGPQAQRIVNDFFLPRLFCTDDDGQKIKLDETNLSHRLRMTMVGFSLGGPFIRQILNGLEAEMLNGGYTQEEINNGMKNIFVLSMAGTEPFANPHHNSGIRITDIKDPIATEAIRDFRIHPSTGGSMQQQDGQNSANLWVDHPIETYKPNTEKNSVMNPSGVIFTHSHLMKHDGFLPQAAIRALLNSTLEGRELPSLDSMYKFDTNDYAPDKLVGKDKTGFALYESDILLQLSTDQEVINHAEMVFEDPSCMKDAKHAIAERVQHHFGEQMSKNASIKIATTFINRIRDHLKQQPDLAISERPRQQNPEDMALIVT